MSKKHFEMIARVIANLTNTNTRRTVAEEFANELASTNPRFDRERFLKACGAIRE